MQNFQIELLQEHKIIKVTLVGDVNLQRLINMAETIYAFPGYDPAYSGIFDLRNAVLNLDFNDIFAYVNHLANHKQRLRGPSVIITEDSANFGMARMFDSSAQDLPEDIHFANTVDEALSLLINLSKQPRET